MSLKLHGPQYRAFVPEDYRGVAPLVSWELSLSSTDPSDNRERISIFYDQGRESLGPKKENSFAHSELYAASKAVVPSTDIVDWNSTYESDDHYSRYEFGIGDSSGPYLMGPVSGYHYRTDLAYPQCAAEVLIPMPEKDHEGIICLTVFLSRHWTRAVSYGFVYFGSSYPDKRSGLIADEEVTAKLDEFAKVWDSSTDLMKTGSELAPLMANWALSYAQSSGTTLRTLWDAFKSECANSWTEYSTYDVDLVYRPSIPWESEIRYFLVDESGRNQAISTLLSNLKESEVNIIANLVEIKEWGHTIPEIAKALTKDVKSIRSMTEESANAYLSYKYGDRLTMDDIKSISKTVARGVQTGYQTTKASYIAPITIVFNDGRRITVNGRKHLQLVAEPSTHPLERSIDLNYRYNLITLTNAWDIVPFSFVCDWVFDVSALLTSIDNDAWKNTLHVRSFTETTIFSYPCRYNYAGNDRKYESTANYYKRVVSESFPSSDWVCPDLTFPSLEEFVTGTALFVTNT